MKKTPSLFARSYDRKDIGRDTPNPVSDEVNPQCLWVVSGEGRATRKWDGLAVLIENGVPFRRYDAKKGRTPPADFKPAQPAPDAKSGHWPGWVPVTRHDTPVLEALQWATTQYPGGEIPDGTWEAVGPKIGTRHGANPEKLDQHILVRHGADELDAPVDFDGLMEFLRDKDIEGIVWHHPDGRMAKIKKADFPYPPPGMKLG